MCGIIGFFDMEGKHATPDSALKKGMDLMESRGPDDRGIWSAPSIILGHRRLSVIDIDGGSQPLIHEPTGTVIVFNGEIYNFMELRKKLTAAGHELKSKSDTEVLLHSYLAWGTNCLEHLSGMFAFAIYDPRSRKLFAARDRFGIKPLFFSHIGSTLMFASSCAALRCLPGVSARINMKAVSHYLSTLRNTMGRQTLYNDISTLLPGEQIIATYGSSQPEIRRYWDLPALSPEDKKEISTREASDKVYELLTNSVKEQLISDVPLGGFLSGGIDSSILSRLASELTDSNYNAYSVGYDLDGYNEWPFVRESAKYHGMKCTEINLSEDNFPDDCSMLIDFKGLPISTPNEIAIYHLAKALRNDFTVALSGEGADEIFGGYTIPYFSAYDYERAMHEMPAPGTKLSPTDNAIRRFYRRPYLLCRPDHYFLVNTWMSFDRKRSLLTPETWNAIDGDAALFDHYEEYFKQFDHCSTLDAYMQIHARINMEGLLSRVDSSTMAASVEARVPFTDHRIAEYLFSLPDKLKIDWQNRSAQKEAETLNIIEIDRKQLIRSKILLREAFSNQIPESIMNRQKVSFPVPFREWLADGLKEWSSDIIRSSPLVGTLFSHSFVNAVLNTADQPGSAMILWPLTNLCLWQKQCGIET